MVVRMIGFFSLDTILKNPKAIFWEEVIKTAVFSSRLTIYLSKTASKTQNELENCLTKLNSCMGGIILHWYDFPRHSVSEKDNFWTIILLN